MKAIKILKKIQAIHEGSICKCPLCEEIDEAIKEIEKLIEDIKYLKAR